RRRHTRSYGDWSSDVCSSDLALAEGIEFVIVAARAAKSHAEQRGTHDVGHLREHLVAAAGYLLIAGVFAQRTEAVEARGDQVLEIGRASCRERGMSSAGGGGM